MYLHFQPLKIVGFYGDGYLEHPAFTLKKKHSVLSFSFRTLQEAAMLLLSTFEGNEDGSSNADMNQEANVSISSCNFEWRQIKNNECIN